MVLKKFNLAETESQKGKSLAMYDLESYLMILLSPFAQWRRRWLSDHAVQVRVPAIEVCHSWKTKTIDESLPAKCLRSSLDIVV